MSGERNPYMRGECPFCLGVGYVPIDLKKVPIDKFGFNRWILRVSNKLAKFALDFGIPLMRFKEGKRRIHQFAGNESRIVAPSYDKKDLPEMKERQRDVKKFGPEALPEAKEQEHRIVEG